jgi:hypothetical protein
MSTNVFGTDCVLAFAEVSLGGYSPARTPAVCEPAIQRPTDCTSNGSDLTVRSHAISSAPRAKTTSPGRRIHCHSSVVS